MKTGTKRTGKGGGKQQKERKPPALAGSAPSLPIRIILIPIDFSVHSRNALGYAVRLAGEFGATLHIVYVVEPSIYPADLGFGQVIYPSYEEELVSKGWSELERTVKEEIPPGINASTSVRTGKPHQEILLEAKEKGADIIVMATHGHTGVEHILFGSTAERVVRSATCPVLTIRPEAAARLG